MFPKKGQVWTYRERGRTLSLSWALGFIGMLLAGIYFLFTQSNWILVILALLGLGFVAMFFFSSEHEHRDEP
jgi:CHASE2 domain-containing sensor protein